MTRPREAFDDLDNGIITALLIVMQARGLIRQKTDERSVVAHLPSMMERISLSDSAVERAADLITPAPMTDEERIILQLQDPI
jgi:hypothetical protein